MFDMPPLAKLAIILDAPSFEPLEPLLDVLEDRPLMAAIGAPLMAGVGPSVVQHLRNSGLLAVLDLRLFADPHRIALLVEVAARAGVGGLTVHLAAGEAALAAAVSAARGRVRIVGVIAADWLPAVVDPAAAIALAEAAGLTGVMGTPAQLSCVPPASSLALRWAVSGDAGGADVPAFVTKAQSAGATTIFLGRSVVAAPDPGATIDAALHLIQRRSHHGRSSTR